MQVNVAAHIKALLYQNDRVIVPNLGGFLASYQPASIELHGHIIPPSKSISFDTSLTFNDNLLIERIVQEEEIAYSLAVQLVDDYVKNVNSTISQGKNSIFSVKEVGRLYLNAEQQLQFVSDGENFLTDAFGLPSVEYFPVTRKVYATDIVPVVSTKPKPSIWRSIARLWQDKGVISFVGISLLLLAIMIPLLDYISNPEKRVSPSLVEVEPKGIEDQNNIIDQNETFQPYEEVDKSLISEEPTENLSENQSTLPVKRVNQAPQKPDTVPNEDNIVASEVVVTPPVSSVDNNTHIIITGAYGQLENAQKIVKKIEALGFTPHIEDIKTKYRVGIQVKGNQTDLKNELKAIRKHYPKAWIKR